MHVGSQWGGGDEDQRRTETGGVLDRFRRITADCNASLTPPVYEVRAKGEHASSAPAWDGLTGMKLEVGNVVGDRRNKNVQSTPDIHVFDKSRRLQAIRKGRNIIKTRWIELSNGGF